MVGCAAFIKLFMLSFLEIRHVHLHITLPQLLLPAPFNLVFILVLIQWNKGGENPVYHCSGRNCWEK